MKTQENSICIKSNTWEFLWYAYFGVPYKEVQECNKGNKDGIIELCAYKAYGDLSRTLNYTISTTELEKKKLDTSYAIYVNAKKEFKKSVRELIRDNIVLLLSGNYDTGFDKWHNDVCMEIVNRAINAKATGNALFKDFHYGQAQKWLNMTLKYMDITGFWEDHTEFQNLRSSMHVPVDNYIMEASSTYQIQIPRENKTLGIYNKNTSKKWSNWSKDDYINFIGKEENINSLRGSIKHLPNWEDENWISIAWKNSAMNPKNK